MMTPDQEAQLKALEAEQHDLRLQVETLVEARDLISTLIDGLNSQREAVELKINALVRQAAKGKS